MAETVIFGITELTLELVTRTEELGKLLQSARTKSILANDALSNGCGEFRIGI